MEGQQAQLSREQLLDYIKKQKVTIKKLQDQLTSSSSSNSSSSSSSSNDGKVENDSTITCNDSSLQSLKSELDASKAKVNKLTMLVKVKMREVDALKKQLNTNTNTNTDNSAIDNNTNTEDFSLEAMESFGMSLVKDFSSIFSASSASSASSAAASSSSSSHASSNDIQLNDLKEQLLESSKSADMLRAELADSRHTITQLNSHLQEQRQQLQDIAQQHREECADLHSVYSKQLEDARALVADALRSRMDAMQLESANKLNDLSSELGALKLKLAEDETRYAGDAELSSSRIQQLTQELEEAVRISKQREASDAENNNEVSSLKSEIAALTSALHEKTDAIADLRGKVNVSLASLASSNSELEQAQSVIATLQGTLDNEKRDLSKKGEELDALHEENKGLVTSLSAIQEQLNRTVSELTQKEEQLRSAAVGSVQEAGKGTDGNDTIIKSSAQVVADKGKKKKKKGSSNDVTNKPASSDVVVNDLCARCKDLQVSVGALQADVDGQRSSNLALKKENEQLILAIESSCAENIKNLKSWEDRSKALEDEVNDKRTTLESAQSDAAAARVEVESLNRELLSLKSQLEESQGTVSEVGALVQEKVSLLALIETLEAKVVSLSEELAASDLKLLSQVAMVDEHKLEMSRLQEKARILEEEVHHEKMKLLESTEDHRRQEEQLVLTANQSSEKVSSLQTDIDRIRREKEEVESALMELKRSHSTQSSSMEEQRNRDVDAVESKLKIAMKKLKGSEEDAAQAREEREQFRRQLLHYEGMVEEGKERDSESAERLAELTSSIQKSDSLRQELQESIAAKDAIIVSLRDQVATLETNVSDFKELIATLETKVTEGNEHTGDDLAVVNERVSSLLVELEATKEAMENQLASERAESEASIKALTEKVQRLKVLLTKTKNAAEEREAELVKLSKLTTRFKRFGIQISLTVPVYEGAKEKEKWCLVFEDGGPGSGAKRNGSEGGLKWVKASAVNQWIVEGSTLIGSWPDNVEDSWQHELDLVKQRSDADRAALQSQLDETNKSFQAYKIRAADALKRLGSEERSERQRAQQVENSQLDSLNETIARLEKQCQELERRLLSEVDMNKTKDNEIETLIVAVSSLKDLLSTEKELNETMKSQYDGITASLERDISALQAVVDEGKRREEVQEDTSATSVTSVTSVTSSPPTASQIQQSNAHIIEEAPDDKLSADSTAENGDVDNINEKNNIPDDDTKAVPVDQSPAKDSTHTREYYSKTGNRKHVLYHQAGNEVNEALALLRQENAKSLMEILEFKRLLALSDEQVNFLKSAVRDLEASLMREKEFNAEHRRINAEYLVNILRSFLMSNTAAEKAKLVGVICSLVHLSPDETKEITLRWSIKGPGIVNWFRQNPSNQKKQVDVSDVATDRL